MSSEPDRTMWPETPVAPTALALRTTLAQLEQAAVASLSSDECADLARWLQAWGVQGRRDPRLFQLGAGLLFTSADALSQAANGTRRRALAFHEAGHAVVASLVGVELTEVTIVSDPVDGSLGSCGYRRPPPAPGPAARDRAEGQAEITLAGPLAEGLSGATPSAASLASHREEALHELLAAGPINGMAEVEAHVEYLRERTTGRLRQCWNAVEVLAHQLLTTPCVPGATAHTLIQAALPDGVRPTDQPHQ